MPNKCVPEALTVECVEQGVSGPVGDAAAPVRLAALPVLVRLSAEGTLQEGSFNLIVIQIIFFHMNTKSTRLKGSNVHG